jgi:quinohemoprotein ethanol dehydrogenase
MDLPTDVGLVSTPLVVDGVLYFTGTMNVIRSVDATSGKLIWEYDPDVAGHIGKNRQVGWVHNRGISFYKGKIFAATWDGRLFALDQPGYFLLQGQDFCCHLGWTAVRT